MSRPRWILGGIAVDTIVSILRFLYDPFAFQAGHSIASAEAARLIGEWHVRLTKIETAC